MEALREEGGGSPRLGSAQARGGEARALPARGRPGCGWTWESLPAPLRDSSVRQPRRPWPGPARLCAQPPPLPSWAQEGRDPRAIASPKQQGQGLVTRGLPAPTPLVRLHYSMARRGRAGQGGAVAGAPPLAPWSPCSLGFPCLPLLHACRRAGPALPFHRGRGCGPPARPRPPAKEQGQSNPPAAPQWGPRLTPFNQNTPRCPASGHEATASGRRCWHSVGAAAAGVRAGTRRAGGGGSSAASLSPGKVPRGRGPAGPRVAAPHLGPQEVRGSGCSSRRS